MQLACKDEVCAVAGRHKNLCQHYYWTSNCVPLQFLLIFFVVVVEFLLKKPEEAQAQHNLMSINKYENTPTNILLFADIPTYGWAMSTLGLLNKEPNAC